MARINLSTVLLCTSVEELATTLGLSLRSAQKIISFAECPKTVVDGETKYPAVEILKFIVANPAVQGRLDILKTYRLPHYQTSYRGNLKAPDANARLKYEQTELIKVKKKREQLRLEQDRKRLVDSEKMEELFILSFGIVKTKLYEMCRTSPPELLKADSQHAMSQMLEQELNRTFERIQADLKALNQKIEQEPLPEQEDVDIEPEVEEPEETDIEDEDT